MLIETKLLKEALIESKQLYFDSERRSNNEAAKAVLSSTIRVIEKLLITIHNAEKQGDDMAKELKLALSNEVISLEEISSRTRTTELEEWIKALAESLKPGTAIPIDPKQIAFGHFATKVYQMRKAKKLADSFVPIKRGEKLFLARKK